VGPPPPHDEADFSLNGSSADVLMDVTLANSNSSFTGFLASFGRNNGADFASSLNTPSRPFSDNSMHLQASPPASPRVWNEMGDFSLSSILGHLETSKPAAKEALLSNPPATDELAAASSAGETSHGLPTSFQFTGLDTPLRPSSQSPPT